tara:strand:+ start:1242 stop:1529 length:288 start_codon:yes stop_codon:yes gene_type:complete
VSGRKTYPVITADEIRIGDAVCLYGRHVSGMPHLHGKFDILKAKPIGKGRVQVKCRDRFWPNSPVRKLDLKIGPAISLIERDGKDVAVQDMAART